MNHAEQQPEEKARKMGDDVGPLTARAGEGQQGYAAHKRYEPMSPAALSMSAALPLVSGQNAQGAKQGCRCTYGAVLRWLNPGIEGIAQGSCDQNAEPRQS